MVTAVMPTYGRIDIAFENGKAHICSTPMVKNILILPLV